MKHAPVTRASRRAGGQSSVLMLGLAGALLAGFLVLASFGQALGAKGRHQRGADLAAVSAARAMRDVYPRLFEPACSRTARPTRATCPRPRTASSPARPPSAAPGTTASRSRAADVGFPGATFAPTRVSVAVRGSQQVRIKSSGPAGGPARWPCAPGPRPS